MSDTKTTTPSIARLGTTTRLRTPVIVRGAPAGASVSRGRRARSSVVWGVAVFALSNVALAVAVETVLPQLRDPEYGYRLERVRARQREHPDRPLVLVVGTSRVQNAIDPGAMDFPDRPGSPLVFNFGQSGSHPLLQLLTLRRLEADGVRPAAVAVEVFPAALVIKGPGDKALAGDVPRLTLGDVSRAGPYLDDPPALRGRWAAERLNTLQSQRPVILSHVAPQWQAWSMRIDHQWEMLDGSGFTAFPVGNAGEHRAKRQAKMRANYGEALRELRVSELSARAHRDLVAHCRGRGIPVAFVLTPESPAFGGWYSPESRKALADYLRTLTDELGCPVFVAPDGYVEEDFADGHHVLAPAAGRFSRELADRHLRPWLASHSFK